MTQIAENLRRVRADIAGTSLSAHRPEDSVSLVAVSKTKSAEKITEALEAGQRLFGENRVQEAQEKWPALRAAYPDARLHLIGPLQSNKVKFIDGLFDMIETLDRDKLALSLARSFEATGNPIDCLVQVNTGAEPQKAGILPEQADAFITLCRDTYELPIKGVMCIPPVNEEPALHFALLRVIARRNGLKTLSMGMSADYPAAIRLGATLVRVGTAIFGERDPYPPE